MSLTLTDAAKKLSVEIARAISTRTYWARISDQCIGGDVSVTSIVTMSGYKFTYRMADETDVEALVSLINRAFEVERPFFTSERIDLEETLEHLRKGTFILVDAEDRLVGCNYVELRGDAGYFGLLSVDPDWQGHGLGRKLVDLAEDFCRVAGCSLMQIRVLNHRTELPPFYEKLEYTTAGIEEVEQVETARIPYHFILMEKELA